MNELKGNYANVVLNINEGQGFDILKCPFYLTANYNGRIMESNISEPLARVNFNTEIVWETEKKQLRKARCGYTAIRLECYTTERRFVGFAMLRLRSAKVIAESSADQEVKSSWTKLLNVPSEWKKGAIQVELSLTIRDAVPVVSSVLGNPQVSTAPQQPSAQPHRIRVPIQFTDDGYIQIGSDFGKFEKFHIKLTSLVACNMDSLLSKDMVCCQGDQDYYFTYSVFGMHIKTLRFSRNLRDRIPLNECIVINVLTTFSTLLSYFKRHPTIHVRFSANNQVLGESSIPIYKMLSKVQPDIFYDWLQGKFSMEEEIVFEDDKQCEKGSWRSPTLQMVYSVELLETIFNRIKHLERAAYSAEMLHRPKDASEPVTNRSSARKQEEGPSCSGKNTRNYVSEPLLVVEKPVVEVPEVSKVPDAVHSDPAHIAFNDPHQVYCLNIIVEVIIWNENPPCQQLALTFLHPKGKGELKAFVDINSMVEKCMLLENIICKLFYMTTKLHIGQLLSENKPIIEVRNGKTEELLALPLTLDSSKLCGDTMEYTCLMPVTAMNGTELAQLSVCLLLEEAEIPKCPNPHHHLLPELIDDAIIGSSLEEHHGWMRRQRLIFTAGLEHARTEEMSRIKNDNQEKREELADALVDDIEKSKPLANEMKTYVETLSIDELEQRRLINKDYDLFLEIHQNLIRYALSDNNDLIDKITELELDNAILRDLFHDQRSELREMQNSRLTPEQVKNLLQDLHSIEAKCENALKDKRYFKNGYEKAVQEVHNLKVERQKLIAAKIADDKESFGKMNMEALSTCIQSLCNDYPAKITEEEHFQEAQEEFEVESVDEGAAKACFEVKRADVARGTARGVYMKDEDDDSVYMGRMDEKSKQRGYHNL